jgi:hypothetical protein
MAVTYTDTLLTDRDVFRATLNDTVSGSGPRPGTGTATNFSDNEIAGLITLEGNVNRAIARAYEILAGAWSRYGLSEIGPRKEDLKGIAEAYRKLGVQWRADYGTAAATVTSGFVTRVDGYSDDIANDEVDTIDFTERWWE